VASGQLSIEWTVTAKTHLRAIEQRIAIEILHCIDRYLKSRKGDVKKLKPPETNFRLRCREHRIFFMPIGDSTILITGVSDRKNAYR
jgi:mRNA-degrading endonuclease RelE of RelBE toxin-antitoxin system